MTFNHPRTEAGVVAAVLNNTDWATDLFDIVEDNKTRTNFFTDPDLAALYTAMVKVASSNDEQVITVDAVIDFLERDVAVLTSEQKPEDKTFTTRSLLALGAEKYVRSIQSSPSACYEYSDFIVNLGLLDDQRRQRGAINGLNQVIEDLQNQQVKTDDEGFTERLTQIATMMSGRQKATDAGTFVRKLREDKASGKVMWAVPTGIKAFDDVMGGRGMKEGSVTVVAARAKVGKTTMMMNLIRNSLNAGAACIVFSYETTIPEFIAKIVATKCHSSWTQTENYMVNCENDLSDEEKVEIEKALDDVETSMLFPSFNRSATKADIQQVVADVKERIPEGVPIVLFVDYIQLQVQDDNKERQEITSLSKFYKRIAGNANIAVCYLAQTNREGADAERPSMKHIKGSGSIEADADSVFLLDSPSMRANGGESSPYDMLVYPAATRAGRGSEFMLYVDHGKQLVLDGEEAQNMLGALGNMGTGGFSSSSTYGDGVSNQVLGEVADEFASEMAGMDEYDFTQYETTSLL